MRTLALFPVFAASLALGVEFTCEKAHPSPSALSPETANKVPVFIYVANDLALNVGYDFPHRNVRNFLAKLEEAEAKAGSDADRKYLDKVGSVLARDYQEHALAFAHDIQEIRAEGCGDANSFKNGMVIVSNHPSRAPVLRRGIQMQDMVIEFCRPEADGKSYTRSFSISDWGIDDTQIVNPINPIYQSLLSQPVSITSHIGRIFELIQKEFPAETYQYVLWMKGYGDRNRVARPFLDFVADRLDGGSLGAALLNGRIAALENADETAIAKNSRAWSHQLRQAVETSFPTHQIAPVSEGKTSGLANSFFSDKANLLRTLERLAPFKLRMGFSHVVWDSDESSISLTTIRELAKAKAQGTEKLSIGSIGYLCTTKSALETNAPNRFDSLFHPVGVDPNTSFVEHFDNFVRGKVNPL